MPPKRPSDDHADAPSKKFKKGFNIGPRNLPDGTHRRKVQQIKSSLIEKAKLKKQYAKIKAQEDIVPQKPAYYEEEPVEEEPAPEPTLERHPDRVKMLEEPAPEPYVPHHARASETQRRQRRARPQPFEKEAELGRQRKEEMEARQKAREEAEKERTRKLAERERFRKTMAKARHGGPNGQRKLGRESTVLLEKARRLVGKP